MTPIQKKYIAIGTFISIGIGIIVLGVVVLYNRNRLTQGKLQRQIEKDLDFWKGLTETSDSGAQRIAEYWKALGYKYTSENTKSPSFQDTHPWSAVYISDLVQRWGAKDRFKYSPSHSVFIMDSKEARYNNDKSRAFWAFAPNEVPVQVGDIIGVARKGGIYYQNLYAGAPTHTDVVYKIEKTPSGYDAIVVGGNVANTVKATKVPLDKNKMIKNPDKYLTILKNMDLWKYRPKKQ